MNPNPTFITPLEVTPLQDGVNWRLVHDVKFIDMRGELHVVHAGFVTDFASIPSLARLGAVIMLIGYALYTLFAVLDGTPGYLVRITSLFLVGVGFLIAWLDPLLNGDDRLDGPAVLHDDGYRRARLGSTSWMLKFYWDWILFQAMRANGEPLWKCWLIWFNVAAFGWMAWFQDGRKHK